MIDLVPEQLKSVELTANWEEGLRQMEEGKQDVMEWINEIKEYTRELVELARNQEMATGVAAEKNALGKCPVCKREVVETTKSYGCIGYKEGCKFAIWKEIAGKKITLKQAEDLLTKGKTGVLKGFRGKSGNSFEAILIVGEGGKVAFDFPNRNQDSSGAANNRTVLAHARFVERMLLKIPRDLAAPDINRVVNL
ncbi:hypothetical protein N752_29750 [Desulforamulus aquiferis]|nr:hypothetical protein N752_29750 [Desulforamulus aquiferis]